MKLAQILKSLPKPRLSDETIRTACIVGGFLMALRGLYLWCPPLMWLLGGLFLIWFGWPPAGRR